MENNERNGFSIVGFIAQVLVILLFVFVLMWLFPTKSYLENNKVTENNTQAITEVLLNQNLASMKDAAKEYFTVKRMPSKNGDSKTLSLAEMINNSMVVELIDANGNKCDQSISYVKVTKVDSEYEMEVSLTCGSITKKIKTTIGCYNYCESGLCEKTNSEVTLYQYSKTIEGTSGWSNWSKWSKTVVNSSKNKEVETKVVNEVIGTNVTIVEPIKNSINTCPNGYTLSKDEKKCIKTITETTSIDAKTETVYTCPTGFLLSTDKKSCIKNTTSTSKKDSIVTTTYTCPSGYTLSADKKNCSKSTISTSNLIPVYTCSEGVLKGTECVVSSSINAVPHIKVSFDCSTGVCKSVSNIDYYYCTDSSYTVSGSKCIKSYTTSAYVSSYKCASGFTKSGNQCVKTNISTIASTVTVKNSCEAGYTLTSDKNSCVKSNTTISSVESSSYVKYSCESGYTLKDNKCYKNVNVANEIESTIKTNYSCKTGKLNSNNLCEITEDVYGDVTYYRYRTYTTTSSKTVYKWSSSNNDQSLINDGYKYTGVTKTSNSNEKI